MIIIMELKGCWTKWWKTSS